MNSKYKLGELALRFGLASIFFYFGFDAVTNPEAAAGQWIRPEIHNIISSLLPITVFMITLGSVQLLLSITILLGFYLRISLLIAAGLLVGIIINLGFNDIAIRYFVILTSILYLLSMKQQETK